MLTLLKIILRSLLVRFGWHPLLGIARHAIGHPGTAYKSVTADAYVAREAPRNYIFTDNASSINVTNTSDLILSDNYLVANGYKIITEDGFAYVVEYEGATFTILNVSDAENITFVNSEELVHGDINRLYDVLHYTGDWVIALGSSYLIGPPADPDVNVWAIDVTDKGSPSITRNSIVYGYSYRTSGWVQGDYLYVAIAAIAGSVEDQVSKCDLSGVPTVIEVDSLLSDTYDSGFAEITGSGDYFYISWYDNDIIRSYETATLDVADTISITSPKGMAVDGNYLYVVCDTTNSVRVIDISDPTSLSEHSSLVDNTNLSDASFICLSPQGDKTAYVACPGSDRVTTLNITNPAAVTVLDSLADAVNLSNVSGIAARTLSITTITSDAIIKGVQSKTVLADAIIDALKQTITADSFIDAFRKAITADAYIDPFETQLQATMPVSYYAAVDRTLYSRMPVIEVDDGSTTSNTISAIMAVVARLTNPVTADAFIKQVASQAITSDAFIDALRKTVTVDAYIRSIVTAVITSDAFIDSLRKTITVDAFIKAVQSKGINADAIIKAVNQKAVTADAFIRSLGRVISNVHLFASMMLRRR